VDKIATEYLFEIALAVGAPAVIGAVTGGERRVVPILGGMFSGPRLSGKVLPIGEDALLIEPSQGHTGGRTRLDVRIVLETDDGAAIYAQYRGLRSGPAEVMAQLAAGAEVDPAAYYFRTALTFETGAARYSWLNDLLAIGIGRRPPSGPVYRVFAVL